MIISRGGASFDFDYALLASVSRPPLCEFSFSAQLTRRYCLNKGWFMGRMVANMTRE